ncbi:MULTISPECIES: HAD-IA family hydrolase [unclassified Clostridium]|uniref:HAD-IA family hydrolase n=1 Tax=unclassified Clostridium TaxID=2614128 RepID=UPI00207AEE5B|nr:MULTISPECIES: HAD-IA family hydrolase [unclassified Clostridium]
MNYIKEINKLKENVENSDIVSFDIFDTLLLRNVINPTDIFKIVEIEYFNRFGKKIVFYNERIESEKNARKISKCEDIRFDEIYEVLGQKIGKDCAEKLKLIEIEIEQKFIITNKYIKEIYDYAKTKGKKIIIISDMYLSKGIIQNLLKLNNYLDYDKLYVSCEVNKTKASGSIYSYIRNEINIDNSQKWIHIGDNYTSDVENANKNGIIGIHYEKLQDREERIKINNLSDSIIYAIQINNKYSLNSNKYWKEFGTMYVAPIYIGLMYNLMKWLKDKDNIYFLARDGYMPYKLYEKLKQHYNALPIAKYIYASRRAYIYPTLINNKEKAIDFFTIYNGSFNQKLTIKEIFNNLDLDLTQYTEVLNKYNFTNIEEVITDKNIDKVKSILSDIWDDIDKKLLHEKELLNKYFIQEGIIDFSSINIFDVGWAGSTHKAMIELLDKEINGYYFGTIEFIDSQIKNRSFGYAFNEGKPSQIRNFIIDNVMMYELIFTAPEGSLKNFKCINGKIFPQLKDTQDDFGCECIEIFQKEASKIFEITLKYKEYVDEPSKEFVLSAMKNFIEEKKMKDLLHFSKIDNVVSIGESKDSKAYVTKINCNDYLDNRNYYKEESLRNLWRGSILIEDNQERFFNDREFDKLLGIRNYSNKIIKIKKIINLLKKAIKNPKKAINKLICIVNK